MKHTSEERGRIEEWMVDTNKIKTVFLPYITLFRSSVASLRGENISSSAPKR